MGSILNALLAEVMKDPALNQKQALLSLASEMYHSKDN